MNLPRAVKMPYMPRIRDAVAKRAWSSWKLVRAKCLSHRADKSVLFILGCQRSGTTLVTRIFERDPDARVYGEFSKLSRRDGRKGIRLISLSDVRTELNRQPFPLLVLKPLVESQNARDLLAAVDGSKALWLYRHYADVASSDLEKFGLRNGIDNIRPMVERQTGNWRSERLSGEITDLLRRKFSESMNPFDAAALFWFARNHLFFDLQLDCDANVMPFPYDELVTEPDGGMRFIYDFLQRPYPGKSIVNEVRATSIGKGRKIGLSPDIQRECDLLLSRLKRSYETRRTGAD